MSKLIGLFQWLWGFLSPLLSLLGRRAGRETQGSHNPGPERQPAQPAPHETPAWFALMEGQDDPPGSIPEGYDGTHPLADKGWAGLIPTARNAFTGLQAACRSDGIAIFLTEGYRPRRRQAYLYSIGRTIKSTDPKSVAERPPLGRTVTDAMPGESNHQSGRAFDIAVRGAKPFDESTLMRVGIIGKSQGLVWGGDWKSHDTPHFQVPA